MSTTYNAVAGESYATIALKFYGDESQQQRIFEANPSVVAPFLGGESITIPDLPSKPRVPVPDITSDNPNEVAVVINGERFRFWEVVSIHRQIDSFDTLQLGGPYEPDQPVMRRIFTPFSYNNIDVFVGGKHLFSGTNVRNVPLLDENTNTVTISAYSTPGVINDCTISSSQFPAEFNNQSLREIAEKLSTPFDFRVAFESDQGSPFERVSLGADKTILKFLTGLASQRGLIVSNNSSGDLLFTRARDQSFPVAEVSELDPIILKIEPLFNEQNYYSEITGLSPLQTYGDGSRYTVKNKLLQGVYRPFIFEARDVEAGGLKTAVEAKVGRMLASVVSYNVTLNTWRDREGNLWRDNTTFILEAPRVMIFTRYKFLIRSVVFNRVGNAETAVLNLILPTAFNNQIPESLPWQE